jgi:uridine kinase
METDKVHLVINKLNRFLEQNKNELFIIGIDGVMGAGKTTLAQNILQQIPGILFGIDEYLDKHKGQYQKHIFYSKLINDIEYRIYEGDKRFIIEGICLLSILKKIGITPNVIIYIKHLTELGCWDDQEICDPSISMEEANNNICKFETKPGQGDKDRELAEYHRKFQPIQKADIVFIYHEKPNPDVKYYER